MKEIGIEKRYILRPLFASFDDTTVTSCLEGRNSSRAWADDDENPTVAKVLLGGFREGSGGFAFIAGDKNAPCVPEMIKIIPEEYKGLGVILVPPDDSWGGVIKAALGEGCKKEIRYATSKTEAHFDKEKLSEWASALDGEFELRFVDRELFSRLEDCPWSHECVGNFKNYDEFERDNGLAVACLHGDEIVGVVGSFSAYSGGIEIEIDTKEEYRRRGIARAGAAKLILECLERGLYPSWDAATTISLSLAKSLGYVFKNEYGSYWVKNEVK